MTAIALLLGCGGASLSAALIIKDIDARLALALAPADGRITALAAQQLTGPEATAADRDRSDRLARKALRQDPLANAAASTLAFNALARGDTPRARRYFAYAERLSRRDVQAQLWSIEDAVSRGDVHDALRHYDIVLRSSPSASEVLFPILASAVANPPIRDALVQTLAGRPEWGAHLIGYIVAQSSDLRAASSLLAEMRRSSLAVSPDTGAVLMDRLFQSGLANDAWNYYALIHPGSDRRASRDPTFTADWPASPFDWKPGSDPSVMMSIQRAKAGGTAEFSSTAVGGGAALQQKQLLPPGTYRLSGEGELDKAGEVQPYWSLSCDDGRELGRVVFGGHGQRRGSFDGQFVVPSGCPVQTLALFLPSSGGVEGTSGRIDRVRLAALNTPRESQK